LFNFLAAGPTGILLNSHIRRNGMVIALVGEDSRYAGHSFTTNHRTDGYAAYYGRLSYQKGLRLLPTSVIMANTFDPATTDYYENTTAAVSYAVVADSVRYGIYLNQKNYVKFYPQDGRNHFKAMGDQSVLILMNSGTEAALASQPVSNGGAPRDYAGFAFMQYVLLNGSAVLDAGIPIPSTDAPYEFEYPVVGVDNEFGLSALRVFPNPSSNGIFSFSRDIPASRNLELSIVDIVGRTLLEQHGGSLEQAVDLSGFPDGVYLLRINNGKEISSVKVIKQR